MNANVSAAEAISQYIERNTEPRVIARGKAYFKQGAIAEHAEEVETGIHEFSVRGTDFYYVKLILNPAEPVSVRSTSCTCPYSGLGICKHIVAALLSLEKRNNPVPDVPREPLRNEVKRQKKVAVSPRLRSASEPYKVENFSKLSHLDLRQHFTGTALLQNFQSVSFKYSGGGKFNVKVVQGYRAGADINGESITLESKGDDLRIACTCGKKVEKLCNHAHLVLSHLAGQDALHKLKEPSDALQAEMAIRVLEKHRVKPVGDWRNYLELKFHNLDWKLVFKDGYKNLIHPKDVDEERVQRLFRPETSRGFTKWQYGDPEVPFQVGFTMGFYTSRNEIHVEAVVAKADKKGRPMQQGFTNFEKALYTKNVVTTPADQRLLALGQLLATNSNYNFGIEVDAVEQIHLNKELLANHPYLFYTRYPKTHYVRKSDLVAVRFVPHTPRLIYRISETDEFIQIDIEFRHEGEVISIADDRVDQVHAHFLKVENTLYFLYSDSDAALVQDATTFCGRKMWTSQFPAFFQKYLQYALESHSIDVEGLRSYELSEISTKALSREIYLSEESQMVLFKPLLRHEGDLLVNVLTEKTDWEMDGNTLYKMNRDEIEAAEFNRLLARVVPEFESRLVDDCFYISYEELQKDHLFEQLFDRLEREGVAIFGLRELKGFRTSPFPGKVKYSVRSNMDWFEVKMEVAWGDMTVGLEDLKKRFVPGTDYVELSNGSRGMLPAEWVKKLERLFRHGKIQDESLQISNMKFSLVDELFDLYEDNATLKFIEDRKAKLLHSESSKNAPLPKGVKAKLRPYQEHGFQWLCSLHAFGWGGILADDMGLGKTLQVIVFLKYILETNKQPNLIVVPTSLLFNWENELKKFAPTTKAHFHYGANRSKSVDDFEKHQVILTTYGTMLSDIELIRTFEFNYVILDESQAIKNAASKRYKAARLLQAKNRLAMTGTPIENNTFDLYAQMSFLNPGFLGSTKNFKEEYAKPIDFNRNQAKASELQQLVKPFVLRRTKEQVATELPDKIEEVLYCEMGKAQRKVYDAHRNDVRNSLIKKLDEEGLNKSRFAVLEGLTRLRQICDSPELLPGEEKYQGEAEKIDLLMMHIKEKTANHKILVFSQFVKMLKIIERRLIAEGISYAYLDGKSSTVQRQANVDRFQNEADCRVFLISLKAGGTGLNLMAADYVYIVDPWWNPAVENQAIDRCYRIGQKKKVIAYRLIARHTVEEKIMALQNKKRAIAGDIISTDEGVLKKLTKADLLGLFDSA